MNHSSLTYASRFESSTCRVSCGLVGLIYPTIPILRRHSYHHGIIISLFVRSGLGEQIEKKDGLKKKKLFGMTGVREFNNGK